MKRIRNINQLNRKSIYYAPRNESTEEGFFRYKNRRPSLNKCVFDGFILRPKSDYDLQYVNELCHILDSRLYSKSGYMKSFLFVLGPEDFKLKYKLIKWVLEHYIDEREYSKL